MNLPHYLQRSPKRGTYSFRLAVPNKLRDLVGKREIKKSLKTNDPRKAIVMAMKLYDDAQQSFQALNDQNSDHQSERELYQKAVGWLRSLGIQQVKYEGPRTEDASDEYIGRMALADRLIDKLESGKGTDLDGFKVEALQGTLVPPPPTVKDAVKLYLKDRNAREKRSHADRQSFEQMVRRNEGYLLASLGGDRKLTAITRADARSFLDFMKRKTDQRDGKSPLKAGSINKTLTIVSAIFNHANIEFELNLPNPFRGLKVEDDESRRDKRRSFTEAELVNYLKAMQESNKEAYLCTVLMAYTGARTAEITGLEVADIRLDCDIPHLIIRPNKLRPKLKTGMISRRFVPLLGDALAAATEAVRGKDNPSEAVFPRYAKPRGEDNLSAVQMKVIRDKLKITDRRLAAYSTRHTLKDKMRNALVQPDLQDAILGHTRGSVSEGYGDGYWLPLLKDALSKSLLLRSGILAK
jgi:integrase